LALDVALYTFLQILSVHSFEKIPILHAFSQGDPSPAPTTSTKCPSGDFLIPSNHLDSMDPS
jgi:hypothetical protein